MHKLARSLAQRLPPGTVSTAAEDLVTRSRDRWSLALLRQARGYDDGARPAAVAFPTSTEQVATVLAWAQETGTPVAPRGGGSGVCGGVAAGDGWVVLDLYHLDQILTLDAESHVVGVQAGVRGDRLEAFLAGHGLTVGHYPQSIALSTVGGWVAAASAGQASTGYGAIEAVLLGLTAVLAGGRTVRLRATPRSAAGPDLRRLLVGSEGTLAVLTEAVLACSPRPPAFEWDGFRFDTFPACLGALRDMVRTGAGMAVLRGYDEVDSALAFGAAGNAGGCAAIAGFAADLPGLAERRRAAGERARAAGGSELGPSYGLHWWEHRNDAVDLYHRIMGAERLFGPGVAVDTVEVAGLWGRLPDLTTQCGTGWPGTPRPSPATSRTSTAPAPRSTSPSWYGVPTTTRWSRGTWRPGGRRWPAAWRPAGRSPTTTASAGSRPSSWRESWARRAWICCGGSRRPWIPSGS